MEDEEDDALNWISKHKQSSTKNHSSSSSATTTSSSSSSSSSQSNANGGKNKGAAHVDYTSADLKGIKVAHSLASIEHETILTLADSTIEENELEGDKLASVDIMDQMRLQKNLDNKKAAARKGYTGYDDDEFAEGTAVGTKRNILSKYDEDINGFQQDYFVLDDGGRANASTVKNNGGGGADDDDALGKDQLSLKLKRDFVSLDFDKKSMSTDYYTKEEADAKLVKKSKKKSLKKSQRKRVRKLATLERKCLY